MRGSYQTKQRRQILDYLTEHPDQSISAKEIYAVCRQDGVPVSLATIYRQLEQLTQEGRAKKIVTSDGTGIRFQYVPEPNATYAFYMKCDHCGVLTQMDCRLLNQVFNHMDSEHGFQIDAIKSVLYGRCQSCKA